MHTTECVVLKILSPTKRKADWLEQTADKFAKAVQLGLEAAQVEQTSSRNQIHKATYYPARALGLYSDYARMAVNASVSLARSYYGLRKGQQRVTFPRVNGTQGIGLGVDSYKVVVANNRFVLRISTGIRGKYIWLPLCVPARYRDSVASASGDAKIFRRGNDWYVSLPVRVQLPTVCDGEPTFIGVDLGIVRHAVVAMPDKVLFFSGKADRQKREHFADMRRRYGRHHRTDRIKASKGRERRWMQTTNHKLSRTIVDAALQYPNPVIVLERLDGIRYRVHGSKRFNRMVSSWTFRDLVAKIQYKSARAGISVVFCDPRGTSKTCPTCGNATRANRPEQGRFRCVACAYSANADYVAAVNIAAAGASLWQQEPSDTARTQVQTESNGPRPDGVQVCVSLHTDPNLASS